MPPGSCETLEIRQKKKKGKDSSDDAARTEERTIPHTFPVRILCFKNCSIDAHQSLRASPFSVRLFRLLLCECMCKFIFPFSSILGITDETFYGAPPFFASRRPFPRAFSGSHRRSAAPSEVRPEPAAAAWLTRNTWPHYRYRARPTQQSRAASRCAQPRPSAATGGHHLRAGRHLPAPRGFRTPMGQAQDGGDPVRRRSQTSRTAPDCYRWTAANEFLGYSPRRNAWVSSRHARVPRRHAAEPPAVAQAMQVLVVRSREPALTVGSRQSASVAPHTPPRR